MADASMRHIPDELHSIGEILALAGKSTADIMDVFASQAKHLGIRVSWNNEDVRSRFPINVLRRADDASGLAELLQQRKDTLGMKYYMKMNAAGFTNQIFAQLDESMSDWATITDNVLLFDPTWGTNRYGMKLCCFTTVGPTGQTVILAIAIIKYEDKAQIEWSFRCFADVFKNKPVSIYTDGGGSIAEAIKAVSKAGDVWQGVNHILCVFHLSKNFWQHLRPLFVTKPEIWHRVFSLFWRIAKNSDCIYRGGSMPDSWCMLLFPTNPFTEVAQELQMPGSDHLSGETFDTDWAKLVNLVESEGTGSTKDAALKFLDSLYQRRVQWAACFTWINTTWGLNSTQRSEAIHSAIKKRRSMANYQLTRLVTYLIDYNCTARDRKAVDQVRKAICQLHNLQMLPKEVKLLGPGTDPKLTAYGFDLLVAQSSQALNYDVEEVEGRVMNGCQVYKVTYNCSKSATIDLNYNEDGVPKSYHDPNDFGLSDNPAVKWHLTTANDCSCQLLTALRMICRHMMSVRIQTANLKGKIGLLELIGPKWQLISPAQLCKMVHELLRQPLPSRPLATGNRQNTRGDRYQRLLHEFASIIELGSDSEEAYDYLLKQIPQLSLQLQNLTTSTPNNPLPEVLADVGPHGNPDGSADMFAPIKQSRDYKSLVKIMGQLFEFDATPIAEGAFVCMAEAGAYLVGRHIAFKWKAKNMLGWYIGIIACQMEMQEDEEVDEAVMNFSVRYPEADLAEGELECEGTWLYADTYVTLPNLYDSQAIGQWTLLKNAPLGDDVMAHVAAGTLHNPEVPANQKGRKATSRKRAHAGPTSGK